MGSAIEQILATTDEKVKASATDNTPDFLDGKVDATTITVVADELVRGAITGDVSVPAGSNTAVIADGVTVTNWDLGTPSALIGTNISGTAAGLTVGNATNAVTAASANAVATASIDVGDLKNGVDGELITWSTAAVATTVPAGTIGDVLTSGGAGGVPTFQAPAAGGATSVLVKQDVTNDDSLDAVVILPNKYYRVFWYCHCKHTTGNRVVISISGGGVGGGTTNTYVNLVGGGASWETVAALVTDTGMTDNKRCYGSFTVSTHFMSIDNIAVMVTGQTWIDEFAIVQHGNQWLKSPPDFVSANMSMNNSGSGGSVAPQMGWEVIEFAIA